MKKLLSILMTIVTISVLFTGIGYAEPHHDKKPISAKQQESLQIIPDELVVIYKSDAIPEKVKANPKLRVLKDNHGLKAARIKINQGEDIKQVMAQLAKDPQVEKVEYNYLYHKNALDDTYASYQWALSNAKFLNAWANLNGNMQPVTVAVVDTGVDMNHPDLKANLLPGYNAIDGDDPANYNDGDGHGTHVAGIIAAIANNGIGVAGAAYNVCKILPVKVLDDNGYGKTDDLVEGIIYAADHGAKVINLSLGGPNDSYYLREAVKYAYSKGAVIVAAAGNESWGAIDYPAAYANEVIAVAAHDENNHSAFFSNFGLEMDISAPGVDVFSTLPPGNSAQTVSGYGYMSGTSMATPYVSAAAALLLSQDPSLSNSQVETLLEYAADDDTHIPGWDELFGFGRLDADNALLALQNKQNIFTDTNDFAHPVTIAADGTMATGYLEQAGDVDYFKLSVTQKAYYKITLNVPPGIDGSVDFYDKNGNYTGEYIDDNYYGQDESGVYLLEPGDYYFAVYDYYNHWSKEPYKFSVKQLTNFTNLSVSIDAKNYYKNEVGTVSVKLSDTVDDGPYLTVTQGTYKSSSLLTGCVNGVYTYPLDLSGEDFKDGNITLTATVYKGTEKYTAQKTITRDTNIPFIKNISLQNTNWSGNVSQTVYVEASEALASPPQVKLYAGTDFLADLINVSNDGAVYKYVYTVTNAVYFPTTQITVQGLTDNAGNVNTEVYNYPGPVIDSIPHQTSNPAGSGNTGSGGGGGGGGGGGASITTNTTPNILTDTEVNQTVEKVKQPIKQMTPVAPLHKFADIKGHWAEKVINEMVAKGIATGVAPGKFAPNKKITRAEFCAMLVNALKLPVLDFQPIFKDVKKGQWFDEAVTTAYKNGLMAGYGAEFKPKAFITRQEMAALLVRAIKQSSVQADKINLQKYKDSNKISPWAITAMKKALVLGLMNGISDKLLAPKDTATRAEAVVMIKRLLVASH